MYCILINSPILSLLTHSRKIQSIIIVAYISSIYKRYPFVSNIMREHIKRTKKHFSEEKSKTSRVIKKIYQPDKADKVKLYECRENTFDQFARNDTNKFNKIKKQTMHMIQLEKSKIKESVRALVQFQEGKNEEKRESGEKYNNHEFIYVEIVLTQVPGAA